MNALKERELPNEIKNDLSSPVSTTFNIVVGFTQIILSPPNIEPKDF